MSPSFFQMLQFVW